MITNADGNLLDAKVDALVNTVNTVGVMGKGIALQFKQAFPANFKAYSRACKSGDVELGSVFVFDNGRIAQPHFIINFPTKKHWRSRSKIGDVRAGLDDLVRVVGELGITSIAVPPLGCGNGGLDWNEVEPIIVEALGDLAGVDVRLYPPAGAPLESTMPIATDRPAMTTGKAALIALMSGYQQAAEALIGVSQVEVQKLMYFLQASGQPLQLRYERGRYGPYADNLNHVLVRIEGHFVTGFGDRSRTVHESGALDVLPGAAEEAMAFLADSPDTTDRFSEVLDLVAGFESPYALELLSTVHWIVATENAGKTTDEHSVVDSVRRWSERKGRLFTERHIEIAWHQLATCGGGWFQRSAV